MHPVSPARVVTALTAAALLVPAAAPALAAPGPARAGHRHAAAAPHGRAGAVKVVARIAQTHCSIGVAGP
jgi:hypothetical protein